MIEKVEIVTNMQPQTELEKAILRVFNGVTTKLNEVIDAVNTIQKEREAERFEIQEWIGILEAVRESVNIHEEQIDELQMKLEPHKCEPIENGKCAKNAQDPYAEQRKWIGYVCRFWNNDDTQEFSYGVLTAIDTDFGVGYSCNGEYEYDNCEPVKPDDDIIYKGGNK